MGADTFDCVNPSRGLQRGHLHRRRYNVNTARHRRSFIPLEEGCDCYTCTHYTRAYLHHLFKAKGRCCLATLATIHNERFTVRLLDNIRAALSSGDFTPSATSSSAASTVARHPEPYDLRVEFSVRSDLKLDS